MKLATLRCQRLRQRRTAGNEQGFHGVEAHLAGGTVWRAEAKQVPRGRAWYLHRFAVTELTIRMAPFG